MLTGGSKRRESVTRLKSHLGKATKSEQVEIARKLSRVLPSSAVKRVLRNCGLTLGAVKMVEEGEDGDEAQHFSQSAGGPEFDDAALRCIATSLWSQSGMPSNGTCGKVAGVLGVTEARFRHIAEESLKEVNHA